MDHSINQTESAKQKARNKANIDNSVKRLTQEVDDEVGGKPPDDASIEAWDRYLNDFMEAMQRRDEEHAKNSWTQLGKAEQFINKMRQQEFRLVGDNIAEGTLPRSSGSTVSHQRKGRTERNRAVKPTNKNRGPVELSHGVCGVGSREISRQTERVEESERQAAPIDNPFARSPSMLQNSKQPGSSTAAKHTLSSDPVDIAEGRDDQRPMKKRRSGPAALESNLGKNWEPHVDAEGHRPSRNKSKKS
ncbi:hypothetical protein GGS26DRAFT_197017 [Hypomontagnella submonticulosa]|nr:hypothetical protein GGS26DRAFT_197017 [Hypomontagnella submonticulosa]